MTLKFKVPSKKSFTSDNLISRQKMIIFWLNMLTCFTFSVFEFILLGLGKRSAIITGKVWILELVYLVMFLLLLTIVKKFLLKRKYQLYKNAIIYVIYSFITAIVVLVIGYLITTESFRKPSFGVAFILYIHSAIICTLVFINLLIQYYIVLNNFIRQKEYDMLLVEKNMLSLQNLLLQQAVDFHFVHNILSSLYHRLRASNVLLAEKLVDLADIIVYAEKIMKHKGALVNINDELEQLSRHLTLLEELYPERPIRLDIEVSDNDKYLKVMPLLFSELLQNMYKHGTWNTYSGAAHYYIHLTQRILEIETCNTINLKNAKYGMGLGLHSINEQLMFYYPENHFFTIKQSDGIFMVNLKINL